jgi:hypothetical protein
MFREKQMGQYSNSSVFGIFWNIAKRAIIEGVQKEAFGTVPFRIRVGRVVD